MKAVENYKIFVNTVVPSLKEWGFKKCKDRFYLQGEETWGIIDFQKSTKSAQDIIVFTVNLGVASKRLLKLSSRASLRDKPIFWDCQWQVRLGHLMAEHKDLWWTIESQTPIDVLSRQIQESIIKLGIPEILKYMSDASLRDLWLSNKSPSLSNIERLRYLSVLLEDIGPHSLLTSVRSELENSVTRAVSRV